MLDGSSGASTLLGGQGDDLLIGSAFNDSLDGGAGIDTLTYENNPNGIFVSLELGFAQGPDGGGFDRLSAMENVIGTAGDDYLAGDAGDNSITGGDGRDGLEGGSGGHDVLDGGAGDDYFNPGGSSDLTVIGGEGIDQILFFGADFVSSGVVVDLGATGAQQIDATHVLTMSGVEDFFGTTGADTAYASDDVNRFYAFGVDRFVFRSLSSLGSGSNADTISRMVFDPDPTPGAHARLTTEFWELVKRNRARIF